MIRLLRCLRSTDIQWAVIVDHGRTVCKAAGILTFRMLTGMIVGAISLLFGCALLVGGWCHWDIVEVTSFISKASHVYLGSETDARTLFISVVKLCA